MKETKYAGTQTEKNLMAAFAGESEARNKYTYFASILTLGIARELPEMAVTIDDGIIRTLGHVLLIIYI